MIITQENNYEGIDRWLEGKHKVFVVAGKSISKLRTIKQKLDQISTPLVWFSDFEPNPVYESVVAGVELFRNEKCDAIMAIGGGSAIDVAKCIKLFSFADGNGEDGEWLKSEHRSVQLPFLAVPSTAGSGSEATRYAVIYYKRNKQSITNDSLVPDTVLLDPTLLDTLPLYQKKATMCDALCHAIESFWSVNSTEESRKYSKEAIAEVMLNMKGYLNNTKEGTAGMLNAANKAGKAINITQTTAGHAMCYKITGLFGLAHGHAAFLCTKALFSWMQDSDTECLDSRGKTYIKSVLNDIGKALGGKDAAEGVSILNELAETLDFEVPSATEEQFDILVKSVNPDRLKNHPVKLDKETIINLYHQILKG